MLYNKLFNVPFEKLKKVHLQVLSCEQYYQIKNFLKKYAQTQIHVLTVTERYLALNDNWLIYVRSNTAVFCWAEDIFSCHCYRIWA